MKRNAIYTLIACLFLAACSSEEEWMISDDQTPAIELGEDQIAVQLNLQTTDFTVEETRSANPIDLQIENPMYNLWLLHYNEEGGLVESDTEYIHLNNKGELATDYTARLTLTDSNKGTLCLIANLEGTVGGNNPSTASVPNNDNRAWPKTLQLLQKELLTLPINRNATDAKLGLPSKMFMYGFYQGTLSTSHPVNITLGRMAARLDIVIKAVDSESTLSNLRLQLKNAVIKSHYSPMKVGSEENIYVDFPEDNTFKDKEVTSSSPITCYYFTGENITPESGKETVLIVKADKVTTVTEEIEKTIQVTVKCDESDRGAIKCTVKSNPDPSRQYGGFIDYDSGKEYIARRGIPVYYKWVDRTITEKVEVEKTIPYTYTIKLGANAPGTSDDYSLYRNNNYTFNINLK